MQKSAGCIIGKDYPAPILDEKASKARCIARLKAAYAVGLHGDAPEVLDGSADAVVKEQEPKEDPNAGKKRPKEGPMDGYFKKAKN